ncbi:kunitz-type serine protease inhibitor homolog alpha-dendrotoxin-like [Drosophila kikkawai]|uniref:Kunitz-type serine protease inhibitor homolog alpha-dendrotoxin-like n=1 Tax=Drosophila kikkawai TaxID=30033 RepID=A0A6P4IDE5_DROKI
MARRVAMSFVILLLILEVVIAYEYTNLKREMQYSMFRRRYDICHLPMQPGKCRHGVKAWYYNHVTKKCQRFIYTLCGGNENRFYTNKECMDYCNGYTYIFPVEEYIF